MLCPIHCSCQCSYYPTSGTKVAGTHVGAGNCLELSKEKVVKFRTPLNETLRPNQEELTASQSEAGTRPPQLGGGAVSPQMELTNGRVVLHPEEAEISQMQLVGMVPPPMLLLIAQIQVRKISPLPHLFRITRG